MYYVYILRSLYTTGAIYVGSTSNLRQRLLQHNSGESVYTNKHKPWQVETYIAFSEQDEARNFEKYLKSNSGKAFLLKRLIHLELRKKRDLYKNGHAAIQRDQKSEV